MKKEMYNGLEKHIFEYKRRKITVLLPKDKKINNKWVWRAEFFGAFDYADVALAKSGWYVVHYDVSNMYGCDEAIKLMKDFHDYIVKAYALCQKAAIFGFSRGGLYSFNYSIKYPGDIGLIYLDAPVLDVKSWPGGLYSGEGDARCWDECKEIYGITDENIDSFDKSPVDNIDKLLKTNIPLIVVYGEVDTVVPYKENCEKLIEKYKLQFEIPFKSIAKPDCGHHPHSLEDPKEIVDFIIKSVKD